MPNIETFPTVSSSRDDVPCDRIMTVAGLSAGYANLRHVIEDITFDVHRGERIAVIGPNGAGKSTLFKALVGMIPHQAGHVSINGYDCQTSHGMIGYVPQYDTVDWQFPATVYDVVMMGRIRQIGWLRFPRKADRQAVQGALQQVNMTEFVDRQIGQLSGGQKRRVFIARTLVQETDILLLDEPFSGVDVQAEEEIMETLVHLNSKGITIILSTHDLTLASQFDRLLLIKQRLIAEGTPDEVLKPDRLRESYGGTISLVKRGEDTVILTDEHGHI